MFKYSHQYFEEYRLSYIFKKIYVQRCFKYDIPRLELLAKDRPHAPENYIYDNYLHVTLHFLIFQNEALALLGVCNYALRNYFPTFSGNLYSFVSQQHKCITHS